MRVTEEALVSTVLLNNRILDDIEDLGYPIFHMGTESSNTPDPPWFPCPDAPFVSRLVSFDENKQPINLPYLRYTLTDNEPVILGTQGRDEMVFHGEIKALPALPSPLPSPVDDSDSELLYLDHPFNWAVNHALYRLGDAGILADVHRYRMSYCQLRSLKRENEKLTRIIGAVQNEQEAHNGEIRAFTECIKGIKERLTAAKV